MEDKHKELISASGGLRWQITSFNQPCQVGKTNDVYTGTLSCLETAAPAPSAYQSVEACASCSGRPLFWAVGPEASVEHIRNTTGRPSYSCGLGLPATLENLQLQKTRAPGCQGFKLLWVQKIRGKHAVLIRSCEAFAPHRQRDGADCYVEVTMLIGESTGSCEQCYLR